MISAHSSAEVCHGISSFLTQAAPAPNSMSELTRLGADAASIIAMKAVSWTPKSVADLEPTASITARTSSAISSSGGEAWGEYRSEHPTPRRSSRISREKEERPSRKRAIGGTSHETSTFDTHPGR